MLSYHYGITKLVPWGAICSGIVSPQFARFMRYVSVYHRHTNHTMPQYKSVRSISCDISLHSLHNRSEASKDGYNSPVRWSLLPPGSHTRIICHKSGYASSSRRQGVFQRTIDRKKRPPQPPNDRRILSALHMPNDRRKTTKQRFRVSAKAVKPLHPIRQSRYLLIL